MNGVELMDGEEFRQINGFPNYYISNMGRCYNIKTKHFVGTVNKKDGYVHVGLYNGKGQRNFLMHRLVIQAFGSPMPDGTTDVDHKNHIRNDNRIQNLRYVTRSQNDKNKSSHLGIEYEFFDEIPAEPDDIIEVRDYGNHHIEDIYYANNFFYFDTGVSYRRMHINYDKRGSAFVRAYNTNGERVKVRYTMFKKLYGIN